MAKALEAARHRGGSGRSSRAWCSWPPRAHDGSPATTLDGRVEDMPYEADQARRFAPIRSAARPAARQSLKAAQVPRRAGVGEITPGRAEAAGSKMRRSGSWTPGQEEIGLARL